MAVTVRIQYGQITSISRINANTVRVSIGVGVGADYQCRYWRATANGRQFASKDEQATSQYLEGSLDFSVGPGSGTITVSVVGYATPSQESEGATVPQSYSASYPAQVYTVTFDPVEGTVAETSRSVSYGAALGTLPVPVPPTGYEFKGWFTQGGNRITAATTCTGAATYYAHYGALAVLHLVREGTPETITDIRVVESGTPKQVLSVWSVTNGVPKQGV